MKYSQNLRLKLPESTDPVSVDDLSGNFEKLDAIGGITGGLKAGDIVYSGRNLEEASGGAVIACDQRQVKTGTYPELDRIKALWFHPMVKPAPANRSNLVNVGLTTLSILNGGMDFPNYFLYSNAPTSGSPYLMRYNKRTNTSEQMTGYTVGAGKGSWFKIDDSTFISNCDNNGKLGLFSIGAAAPASTPTKDLSTMHKLYGACSFLRVKNTIIFWAPAYGGDSACVGYADLTFTQVSKLSGTIPTALATQWLKEVSGNVGKTDPESPFFKFRVGPDGRIYSSYASTEAKNIAAGTTTVSYSMLPDVTVVVSDDLGKSYTQYGVLKPLSYCVEQAISDYKLTSSGVTVRIVSTFIVDEYVFMMTSIGSSSGTVAAYCVSVFSLFSSQRLKDKVISAEDYSSKGWSKYLYNNQGNFIYLKNEAKLLYVNSNNSVQLSLRDLEISALSNVLFTPPSKLYRIGGMYYGASSRAFDRRELERGLSILRNKANVLIDCSRPLSETYQAFLLLPMDDSSTVISYNTSLNAGAGADIMFMMDGTIYCVYGGALYYFPSDEKTLIYHKNGYIKTESEPDGQ